MELPARWRVTRRRRSLIGIGCLVLLFGACSDAEPAVTTTVEAPDVSTTVSTAAGAAAESVATTTVAPTTTTGTVAVTLPDPDPVGAEVTLDSAAAVSEVIGPDGGSLAATGSDGRSYRLTIPPNYVAGDVEITMTPIADLSTPVLDEFAGGVQLGPEGLTFPGVVWLEISGANIPENAVGFSYAGEGEDATIGWLEADGAGLRVPITHFSGAGAGTPGEDATSHPPSDAIASMGLALMSIRLNNDGVCIDATDPLGEILPSWYQALFESEVEPKLKAAAADDTLLSDAIRVALRWRAARQYYEPMLCSEVNAALETVPGNDRWDQLVADGLENAIDTAADSCATSHDLGEIRYMLAWDAQAQLLFLDETGDWWRLTLERVDGCLTFELQFHSYVEVENPGMSLFTADMESTITGLLPVAQAESFGLIYGSEDNGSRAGALSYTPQFTWNTTCQINITQIETHSALALLPEVVIPAPVRQVPVNIIGEDTKPPEKVNLVFYRLEGSEYFDAACTDLFGGPNLDGAWGPYTFNGLHENEWSDGWEAFLIEMDRGTGKLYARATYERDVTDEGANIHEETTFDLFHAAPRVP